jgi:Transcriptional regulators
MSKIEIMDDCSYLFGTIFILANRMDTLLQREFKKFDITTKQWFLSIIIDNLFDNPPTIKEAAKEMGSSHQNVKQVALKLEEKGLLTLERDPKDARATKLKLTEKSNEFGKLIREEGLMFHQKLFKDIDKDDLAIARKVIQTLLLHIDEMDDRKE